MSTFHEEFRFGSAVWSAVEDIHRAKLTGRKGPFIGYTGRSPLRLAGDAPLLTIGGSGSGKLRDVIAFNLCGAPVGKGELIAPARLLMNDPRGDGAAKRPTASIPMPCMVCRNTGSTRGTSSARTLRRFMRM